MKKLIALLMGVSSLNIFGVNQNIGVNKVIRFNAPAFDNSNLNFFESECDAYGFSVGTNWVPYYDIGAFDFWEYPCYDNGRLQHYSQYEQILLKNTKSTQLYAFIYRFVAQPKQLGRDWGFFGIGSYGDNWYFRQLTTTIEFDKGCSITNFAPQNSPITGSITIGVGTSEISASISADWSELSCTVDADIYNRKFNVSYYDGVISNYTKYTSMYYGMVVFKSTSRPKLRVTHKVTYDGVLYHGTGDQMSYAMDSVAYQC